MNLRVNDCAKRNDTGRMVRVIEIRPIGDRVFYVVEDIEHGRLTLVAERDLRPAPATTEPR